MKQILINIVIFSTCFILSYAILNGAVRGIKHILAARKVFNGPSGKAFPAHWGEPPRIQTRDLHDLPAGYGQGSSTLAQWIQTNLIKDAHASMPPD